MATALASTSRSLALTQPLKLDSGQVLEGAKIAYETYGELAPDKSNAILIFHALTMDQHVASPHPITGKPGWWSASVGPGKPIDTDRFHVICANFIGSCMGSTGPASPAPDGKPWAMRFPVITIRDMVRAQVALLDALGIEEPPLAEAEAEQRREPLRPPVRAVRRAQRGERRETPMDREGEEAEAGEEEGCGDPWAHSARSSSMFTPPSSGAAGSGSKTGRRPVA